MGFLNLLADFDAKRRLQAARSAPTDDFTREGPAKKKDATSALTRYIPTEVLTVFVAAISGRASLLALENSWGWHFKMAHLYFIFIGANAAFFLLAYLATIKKKGKPLPPVLQWPWFRTVASSIAFAVWAPSVPGTNLIPIAAAPAMGIIALALSYGLTKIESFFE